MLNFLKKLFGRSAPEPASLPGVPAQAPTPRPVPTPQASPELLQMWVRHQYPTANSAGTLKGGVKAIAQPDGSPKDALILPSLNKTEEILSEGRPVGRHLEGISQTTSIGGLSQFAHVGAMQTGTNIPKIEPGRVGIERLGNL
ncbi:MAG: hypothetical protein EOP84_32810 [Verrucomicrobiaceae bacterium]|nr:MAG: hypothetical protein EOP84_32810 [Verrucomicrobiaceae bacterium]